MKKMMVMIFGMILLAGCISTHETMNQLSEGMSRQEVISKMGEPDSTRGDDNNEIMTYLFKSQDGSGQEGEKDYWVELRDGRVVNYGRGLRFLDR
jgi:outer membrane protein assembly factor BamE (lipoprotein component of BamABCDE complex)